MCASWNFTLQDWTPRGCNTSVGSEGIITCICSHLTNFAMLVVCLAFYSLIVYIHMLAQFLMRLS